MRTFKKPRNQARWYYKHNHSCIVTGSHRKDSACDVTQGPTEDRFANFFIPFLTASITLADWTISKILLGKNGCKGPSDYLDTVSTLSSTCHSPKKKSLLESYSKRIEIHYKEHAASPDCWLLDYAIAACLQFLQANARTEILAYWDYLLFNMAIKANSNTFFLLFFYLTFWLAWVQK